MPTLNELLERAEQGDGEALLELGLTYAHNPCTSLSTPTVEMDLELSVEYLRKAVEQGLEEPICHLARLYEKGGDGLPQDLSEAFYWWMQEAKWGQVEKVIACYKVGRAYAEGLGVTQDKSQAIFWLEQAAQKGQAEAQILLDQLKE
jgi:TPR repeat protein